MGKIKEQIEEFEVIEQQHDDDYAAQLEDFIKFTAYANTPRQFTCTFDGQTKVEVETNVKNNRIVLGLEEGTCVFLSEIQAVELAKHILKLSSGLE